jgi:hypothetical protein
VIGILDFAASGAGQVAAEEGFEHQNKGVTFVAAQLLAQHVGGNGPSLANRNWHIGIVRVQIETKMSTERKHLRSRCNPLMGNGS